MLAFEKSRSEPAVPKVENRMPTLDKLVSFGVQSRTMSAVAQLKLTCKLLSKLSTTVLHCKAAQLASNMVLEVEIALNMAPRTCAAWVCRQLVKNISNSCAKKS